MVIPDREGDLPDMADSKSADLRVIGVRPPVPAPCTKPLQDAGFARIDTLKFYSTKGYSEWPGDLPVTGEGRTPA